MRKLFLATCFAGFMLTVFFSTAQAGRLNFMLTNLTDLDVAEVYIAPTYYPDYMTENLLNTNLDGDTRIYIGPDYYGDQRYWNITLVWSNGYKHTWTHSQLTRYNSYMVYVDNYGRPKMRQGYERAFARYSGNVYAVQSKANPSMAVAVGTPEKVNAVASPKQQQLVAAANTGNKRKTRDLVFEDDEETAPAVAGTASADAKGETIAMKATVELNRDGTQSTVLPTTDFKSGDKVRLIFSANQDGYIYWVAKGTSGTYQVLFPTQKSGMDNAVVKNKEYTVPAKGAWRFDDKKGTETVVCILSPQPVEELSKAVKLAEEGKGQDASAMIAAVVNGHENKRTTRDLVFEEEDDADVNTKKQTSTDNEPFVAIYELAHN